MNILVVCLGNICRSPMAEGILNNIIVERNLPWSVDSAGTSSWHAGEQPDHRGIQCCHTYGIDISSQRSRQIKHSDFEEFDVIFAMDASNYRNIISMANGPQIEKVHLLLEYAELPSGSEVPDPYYDGNFNGVYEMLKPACETIIEKLATQATPAN